MELKISTHGRTRILTLEGRFDAHVAPDVARWIGSNISSHAAQLVVSLEGVNFMDSTALAVLVRGMKQCRETGGDLHLCCLTETVRVIFEITRLDKAFEIFPKLRDAVIAFGG